MNRTRKNFLTLLIAILFVIVACCSMYLLKYLSNQHDSSYIESDSSILFTEPDQSTTLDTLLAEDSFRASCFSKQFFCGFTLEGSFDYHCSTTERNLDGSVFPSVYETQQGNPTVTNELIHYLIANGFSILKLPVSFSGNYVISEDGSISLQEIWLERLKQVIDYAYDNNMFVILSSYQTSDFSFSSLEESYLKNRYSSKNECLNEINQSLWAQIADYYKDYDQRLLFEQIGMLSPELETDSDSEKFDLLNDYNQNFVDTIRNSKGNNPSRILIIGTLENRIDSIALSSFRLPKDSFEDGLLVNVACDEFSFDQAIESGLSSLESFSLHINTPVCISNFSTSNAYPKEYRSIHAANFISRAHAHHILCCWADNGDPDQNAIVDRNNFTNSNTDMISALNHPSAMNITYSYDALFESSDSFLLGTINEKAILSKDEGHDFVFIAKDNLRPIVEGEQYLITFRSILSDDFAPSIKGIAFFNASGAMISYTSASDPDFCVGTVPKDAYDFGILFTNSPECPSFSSDTFSNLLDQSSFSLWIRSFSF